MSHIQCESTSQISNLALKQNKLSINLIIKSQNHLEYDSDLKSKILSPI